MTRNWNLGRRWIVPVAGLALLAGLGQTAARAAGDGAAPAGKAKISVKVVDGDGKAVEGATVNLMPPRARKAAPADPTPAAKMAAVDPTTKPSDTPPADPPAKPARPKPLQTAKSDADGAATFTDVADGSYVVQARIKGGGMGREKVTIDEGKDVSVTVTLKPRGA